MLFEVQIKIYTRVNFSITNAWLLKQIKHPKLFLNSKGNVLLKIKIKHYHLSRLIIRCFGKDHIGNFGKDNECLNNNNNIVLGKHCVPNNINYQVLTD